jgi:acyl-CoA reductase-like NAD-dependent aldehyde dehydrogenase
MDPNIDDDGDDEISIANLFTDISSIGTIVSKAHETHASRISSSYSFRISQLRGIERLIHENSVALSTCIHKDLGQGPMYAMAFELNIALSRCQYALCNVKQWIQPRRVYTPWPSNLNIPIHSTIHVEPRGVVTIISPWNMPVLLVLSSLIDALAAGCICILKMSDQCRYTTRLLTQLLSNSTYVDERVVRLINGGANVAEELLTHRVDAISYTGGSKVGRIVALAAARSLTPILLELGGKNPVFVTRNAHIKSAAMRIAWGKITGNTGQMCICPDFVFVEECVQDEFVHELCMAMDDMYPISSYANDDDDDDDGSASVGRHKRFGDIGKMISIQHAKRVVSLLDSTCDVIYGGQHHDVKRRFVAPTIVKATVDSTVMNDEIFGPILPIVCVPNIDNALQFVNERFTSRAEHPLVLYIFSQSSDEQCRIMEAVPSGMCSINEVLKIGGNFNLPFGGIGLSGMGGASTGKFGFDFFSHERGTMVGGNRSTSRWDPSVWLASPF